jgi:ABC-type multidrug transport system permease subunit
MSRLVRKEQLREITLAYAREITREWGVLFWGIGFPILMALGLGIAFTKKADVVRRIAVIENAATLSRESRIGSFMEERARKTEPAEDGTPRYECTIASERLGNTTFVFERTSWDRATALLKRGNIAVAIDERDGRIEYHFDPKNSDAHLSYLKLSRLLDGVGAAAAAGDENIVPLTASGTRYIDFLIPGLMAMGIMMSSLWGMSYGLVEKRTKKLLRRMVATPMKKSHFLVALMTVRLGMNLVESGLLFLFAFLVFGTTIQGSLGALFIIFIAGNVAFAGIAILTSARTSNTEVANGIINIVSLPMMVCSGVFFSYHNFPEWSIPYIKAFPLTLLADGIRSIFIEGAGYAEISVAALVLFAVGIVTFVAGLRAFRWY